MAGPPRALALPAPTRRRLEAAAQTAALLAEPHRLHLLWLLCQHDYDVSALAHTVGAAVPAVSHHLAKLRLAGLVTAHRRGRQKIYTATDSDLIIVIGHLLTHTATDADTPLAGR